MGTKLRRWGRALACASVLFGMSADSTARGAKRESVPVEAPSGTELKAVEVPKGVPQRPYGWRQVAFDLRYVARHPVRWDRAGKRRLWAFGGTTVGLYLLRDEIREWVQDHRSSGRTRLAERARTMGKGGFAPALALGFWSASLATGDEREKETALLLLESMGLAAAAAWSGSTLLAAERPVAGDSVHFFDASGRGVSLDAALAASVIPPLRRQYLRVRSDDPRGKRWLKRSATALLFGGALLTAYQRMDADQHWAPDVFLGLIAGLRAGGALCDAHDEARRRRGRLGLSARGLSVRLGRPPR